MDNSYGKIQSVDSAMEAVRDGCTLMCGGFGGVGTSPLLTHILKKKNTRDITLICNDAGFPEVGIGPVICNGQVSRLIATHIGSNPVAGQMMSRGELEVTFIPQGTFAEQVRAGGVGLEGILLEPPLAGLEVPEEYLCRLNGKSVAMAPALTADVGLIYASRADNYGNLVFDSAGRNTNPLMAMASRFAIVHAEELVESLDPQEVMLPGVFVDAVVTGTEGYWTWPWE